MNIAVIYSSRTGNTKAVAEHIAEVLGTRAYAVAEAPNLASYDGLAFGYWVDRANANAEAREFMASIVNKKVFLFGTLGAYPEHGQRALTMAQSHINDSNEVVGHFLCQGKIEQAIIERFKNMPRTSDNPHAPSPERIQLWDTGVGHPDQNDFTNAQHAVRKAFGL